MLGGEMRMVEHWRKKYLLQAFIVVMVITPVIIGGFYWFDYVGFELILLMGMLLILYLMIKSLREDLQTRGEAAILSKADVLFDGISFDYAKGIKEEELLNQDIVSSYSKRECGNVMKGKDFLVEENWLYTTLSSKFLTIYNTSFRGIILAITASKKTSLLKGKIIQVKGRLIASEEGTELLKKYGLERDIRALLDLFKTDKIEWFSYGEKIYFFIKTDEKLFYQFSLFKVNSISNFTKRIEQLQKLILNFVKAFGG